MRVLVLGGTRFIGLALVEELLGAGHTVGVVHRGEHEPDLPPTVEHIHSARRDLPHTARRSPASLPTPPSTSPR
jgi:nucleoside-diphosphate-sugar epimerase